MSPRTWWASACSTKISMTLPILPPSSAAARRRSRRRIASPPERSSRSFLGCASLVFRTCTKSKVSGRVQAGGMTTISSVISTMGQIEGSKGGRHDGPADFGQAVGSAAGDSGVSGAVGAEGTGGCGSAGAGGGAPDERRGGDGAGRQSADGAPPVVRHHRVGRGVGSGGDVRDRSVGV